jgi:hypothetical protein
LEARKGKRGAISLKEEKGKRKGKDIARWE